MVLVDTSVWVEHLRHRNTELGSLLRHTQVYCHTFIIGELACGHLRKREEILGLLASLQKTILSEDEEVLEFIEVNRLYGRGLGWVDVHLLSSALLTGTRLWTLDQPLRKVVAEFKVAY